MNLRVKEYFIKQSITSEKYILPFIGDFGQNVLEVGCSYGGVLKPFLDRGYNVTGVDINEESINYAKELYSDHPYKFNLRLIRADILTDRIYAKYDLIILKDTIEHIFNKELLLSRLKELLNPDGKIFIAFPPWRMPYGGHQQWGLKLPYIHLMPFYKYLVKGELREIYDARLSIKKFNKLVGDCKVKSRYYLINPNYEVKFGIKPVELPGWMNIPFLRDFYITTVYNLI